MTLDQNSKGEVHDGAGPIPKANGTAPNAEYKVGPGCPPKEFQFKKGQSGNPKGAKRKEPSLAPDLKKLLQDALNRKITIPKGERTRTLTYLAAIIEQLVAQSVKGDRHARKELFTLAPQVGLDLLGIQKALEEALTPNRQAMLNEYVQKQYDRVAPRAPVLAPPALLDDDNEDHSRG